MCWVAWVNQPWITDWLWIIYKINTAKNQRLTMLPKTQGGGVGGWPGRGRGLPHCTKGKGIFRSTREGKAQLFKLRIYTAFYKVANDFMCIVFFTELGCPDSRVKPPPLNISPITRFSRDLMKVIFFPLSRVPHSYCGDAK